MSISIDHLVRSRRKTVALIIRPDSTLMVRAPLRMPEAAIREFVQDHAGWITKNQARVRASPPLPVKAYVDGEIFLFLGQEFPLSIVRARQPALAFSASGFSLANSRRLEARQVFIRWYRAQALKLIPGRVVFYAKKNNFSYRKIRISSARTRWGSCSSAGTLSFTWRLVMAPPQAVDYVVLHELVHTRIRNHSKKFWLALAKLMPEYEQYVSWFKKNGRLLTLGED